MGTLHELPARESLHLEISGRFGDWREPLPHELPDTVPLCRAARLCRLDPGVALTLLVERALVLHDVAWLGHDTEEARTVLGLEAADEPVALGPGHPDVGYARALGGSSSAATELRGIPSLPARLLARADGPTVARILSEPSLPVLLEEAVAWERAALVAGRPLGEWALLVLLAAL